MNDEQNMPQQASEEEQNSNKVFLTTDSALQGPDEFANDKEQGAKDYYSVDDPKKEVLSTIGDGEMHNEGMVGEGNIPDEEPLSQDRFQDEQDKAELRDNQG